MARSSASVKDELLEAWYAVAFIRRRIELERHRLGAGAQEFQLFRLNRLVDILRSTDNRDCSDEIAIEIHDRCSDRGDAEQGFIHRHFIEFLADLLQTTPQGSSIDDGARREGRKFSCKDPLLYRGGSICQRHTSLSRSMRGQPITE